jgi:LDH2 family malate/lactate/ureidoglycolate dehydrogenase
LIPLGSDREHGSHKGFCLGAWVDIFSAVLSGANFGPWVPPFVAFLAPPSDPVGEGIGHFFGAMRVDAFQTTDVFKKNMDTWITRFRSAKTISGEERVIIPGDPEREITAIRKKEGIPLNPKVVEDLKLLGEKMEIRF